MPRKKQDASTLRNRHERKKGGISFRKRYLICTEGKTEALYFGHYRSSTGPIVVPLDKSDHKVNLVKKAIEEKNLRIANGTFDEEVDEAWVVLDRDANPVNKLDKSHFNQALQNAEKNKIFVAYSNDAFELWFLLHYQDLWTAMHRGQLDKMLSMHLSRKYEKPDDVYREIKKFRSHALKRASGLLKKYGKIIPENANPSTTVHILVEKLMGEPGYREEE